MNIGPLEANLQFGIMIGFIATLAIATVLNRFGDAMFRRGVARPFFLGRYRLHHRRFLFVFLPVSYVAISLLVLTGFVLIVWSDLWTGLAATFAIAGACLILDLAVDYARESGGWGYLHHELIYLAVPAFAFTNFLRISF